MESCNENNDNRSGGGVPGKAERAVLWKGKEEGPDGYRYGYLGGKKLWL